MLYLGRVVKEQQIQNEVMGLNPATSQIEFIIIQISWM